MSVQVVCGADSVAACVRSVGPCGRAVTYQKCNVCGAAGLDSYSDDLAEHNGLAHRVGRMMVVEQSEGALVLLTHDGLGYSGLALHRCADRAKCAERLHE